MKGVDVIAFQVESEVRLRSILNTASRQAILESPFNRSSNSLLESIHANFERNMALGLFREYSRDSQIPIAWKSASQFCDISFDFIWDENSFLIMNKMVRNSESIVSDDYVFLPALIPNRFDNDRWPNQKADLKNAPSFLFTFLECGIQAAQSVSYFNNISPELETWLSILSRRFKNSPIHDSPFTEDWFWREVSRRGGLPQLRPELNPTLMITGVCLPEHYSFFSDTDGISEFAYALYTGKWYEVKSPGVLSFHSGVVQSRFKNATCPIAALPSFSELVKV